MPWTNEKIMNLRKDRVQCGLCGYCCQPRGENGTTLKCRTCADKDKERAANKRINNGHQPRVIPIRPWIKRENCKRCREQLPEGKHTQLCEECSIQATKVLTEKKKEWHKNNTCQTCGQRPRITKGSYHLCEVCYLRVAANRHLGSTKRWRELRDLWKKQGGICPYTGDQMQLGVNASIDHIKPHSRYPELRHNIKNVEWVTLDINIMKKNRTKEEFLSILSKILKNIGSI